MSPEKRQRIVHQAVFRLGWVVLGFLLLAVLPAGTVVLGAIVWCAFLVVGERLAFNDRRIIR